MAYSLETELKTLLSHHDFLKLFDHFQLLEGQQIIQTNTYYDTPCQVLKSHRAALRLRNFTTQSEWTLKIVRNQFTSLELTQSNPAPILPPPPYLSLSDLTDPLILEELQRLLPRGQSSLVHQTGFKTHRWIIHRPEGEYALDFCQYGQHHDYELELEVNHLQEGQVAFHQLLQDLNIPFLPADKKIARAFQYHSENPSSL